MHHREQLSFSPLSKKAGTALWVASFLVPLSVWGLGSSLGLALSAGFFIRFFAYELIHRRIHTHGPRPNLYSRWLRRHHLYHHFTDPRSNHGVTTPLWDLIFGTLARSEQVRVPASRASDWMRDPVTGGLREELQEDYQIG